MQTKLIIAGHGGQGVVLMGTVLAHAGMAEGKEVTFFPSYGPEMRGGTANCSVIISSEEIASPIVTTPDVLVVMNEPSLERFEPRVVRGGTIFINKSLVSRPPRRNDLRTFEVRATEIAGDLGNLRVANMVMLGALARRTQIVALSTVIESLKSVLPQRRQELLDLNRQALRKGSEVAGELASSSA